MPDSISVAVVIPHFNDPGALKRALESVSRQTIRPAQVIVVDDKSSCAVRLELEKIADHFGAVLNGFECIYLPANAGPATARNEGWRQVHSDYIAFLDVDDVWHPQKLEIQYGVMNRNPDTVLSSHSFDNATLPGHITFIPNPRTLGLLSWLISNRASTPSVMLKSDITARFPEGERRSEDYQLWLSLAASGLKTQYIPLLLGRCFKPFYGHSGLSQQLHRMELGQLRSIRRGLSVRRSTVILIPLASAWSIIRYFRRLLLVAARRGRHLP